MFKLVIQADCWSRRSRDDFESSNVKKGTEKRFTHMCVDRVVALLVWVD